MELSWQLLEQMNTNLFCSRVPHALGAEANTTGQQGRWFLLHTFTHNYTFHVFLLHIIPCFITHCYTFLHNVTLLPGLFFLPWTCTLQGAVDTLLSWRKLYKHYPTFEEERSLQVPPWEMRFTPRKSQWKLGVRSEYATLALWKRKIQEHECRGSRRAAYREDCRSTTASCINKKEAEQLSNKIITHCYTFSSV